MAPVPAHNSSVSLLHEPEHGGEVLRTPTCARSLGPKAGSLLKHWDDGIERPGFGEAQMDILLDDRQ